MCQRYAVRTGQERNFCLKGTITPFSHTFTSSVDGPCHLAATTIAAARWALADTLFFFIVSCISFVHIVRAIMTGKITSLARCNDGRRAVASWIVLRGYFTRKIALGVVRAVSLKNTVCGDSSLDLNTSSWYMLTHEWCLVVHAQNDTGLSAGLISA